MIPTVLEENSDWPVGLACLNGSHAIELRHTFFLWIYPCCDHIAIVLHAAL